MTYEQAEAIVSRIIELIDAKVEKWDTAQRTADAKQELVKLLLDVFGREPSKGVEDA